MTNKSIKIEGKHLVTTGRILTYLKENGGNANAKEIERNVTGKTKAIYEALKVMGTAGIIIKTGTGTKANPTVYSLAHNPPIAPVLHRDTPSAIEYEEVFV